MIFALLFMLGSVVELSRACERGEINRAFDFTAANISSVKSGDIAMNITDGSASVRILLPPNTPMTARPGDRFRVQGIIKRNDFDHLLYPVATNLSFVGHGKRPTPVQALPKDIYLGKYTDALVQISGTVVDAFRDEVDPRFTFLALSTGGETLYCPSVSLSDEDLKPLIDATISVVGKCNSYRGIGPRAKLGFEVYIDDPADITVLKAAPSDPFDVPMLENTVREICMPPTDAPTRRKLCGTVAAVAQRRRLFVRTSESEISTIILATSDNPPRIGETIEAVGLPETDFYHRNLSRAIYRPVSIPPVHEPSTKTVKAPKLLTDEHGNRRFDIRQHGAVVRLVGTLSDWAAPKIMLMKSDGFIIPVDYSAFDLDPAILPIDSKIEVTGLCVMETDNWRPQNPFPHVTKMSIIMRRTSDLVILSHPPWWTMGRILAYLGVIVTIMVIFLIYRLVRERLGRIRSQLKADERTRLAVELHDSLAQNLTGISLELDTALKLSSDRKPSLEFHLNIASQALKSCRDELRNCLWDLRNRALEEKTMDLAIRQTLAPHLIKGVEAHIRFTVPRTRISDDRAHTILRIIRELSLNAIRHGNATRLWIAGSTEDGKLLFSVRDNGEGFDPKTAPSIQEGHFGLLGIQERVAEFEGEFEITSHPHEGAKAIVKIKL